MVRFDVERFKGRGAHLITAPGNYRAITPATQFQGIAENSTLPHPRLGYSEPGLDNYEYGHGYDMWKAARSAAPSPRIMTGEAYEQSAAMRRRMGPFPPDIATLRASGLANSGGEKTMSRPLPET